MAVRWYLRFNLSYRDVEELLVELGVEADHVTVYLWGASSRICCSRGRRAYRAGISGVCNGHGGRGHEAL